MCHSDATCNFYILFISWVYAYIQVNLGLMTSTILTSPKFNTNSPCLHHEGTWTSSRPWIHVAHPSHVRFLPSLLSLGKVVHTESVCLGSTFLKTSIFAASHAAQLSCCICSLSCLLPYNFRIHWPLSVTFDKVGEISKIRSFYTARKIRACIEEGDSS